MSYFRQNIFFKVIWQIDFTVLEVRPGRSSRKHYVHAIAVDSVIKEILPAQKKAFNNECCFAEKKFRYIQDIIILYETVLFFLLILAPLFVIRVVA
jgi:hypothetical protein